MLLQHATWPEVETYLADNKGIIVPIGSRTARSVGSNRDRRPDGGNHRPKGWRGDEDLCGAHFGVWDGAASYGIYQYNHAATIDHDYRCARYHYVLVRHGLSEYSS